VTIVEFYVEGFMLRDAVLSTLISDEPRSV
jgi:hypothetical protein